MPAKELGTKYTCFKCGTRFYDMRKPDPLCPKCGADQRQSPTLKPAAEARRNRLVPPPKVIEPVEAEEVEGLEGEEETETFEDEEPEVEQAEGEEDF
jgi:uncharacterized protein (TIGR02300 family)